MKIRLNEMMRRVKMKIRLDKRNGYFVKGVWSSWFVFVSHGVGRLGLGEVKDGVLTNES